MRATRKTQYALRGMIFLAKKEDSSSLREIADKEGIPFDYLEKIFSGLEKSGLLTSKRGANGGYTLSVSPEKITLQSVFDAVGEPVAIVSCIESSCPKGSACRAARGWKRANKEIKKTLSEIRLSDLLK